MRKRSARGPEASGTLLSTAKAGHAEGASESLLEIARRDSAVNAVRQSSDNLQARLALAGEDVQRAHAKLVASQRGASRSHTGASFQDDVNATARYLVMSKLGRLERHHPEFVKVPLRKGGPAEWIPKAGGAPCDYSGHVNVARLVGRGGLGPEWRLDRVGVRVPVVFDAKVAKIDGAAYEHDKDRVHQLLSLKEAATTGALAFLLVYVRRIECALLIGPAHFDRLIMGKPVPMLEALTIDEVEHEREIGRVAYPLTRRPALVHPGELLQTLAPGAGEAKTTRPARLLLPAVPHTPGRGWDFAPALGYIEAQTR